MKHVVVRWLNFASCGLWNHYRCVPNMWFYSVLLGLLKVKHYPNFVWELIDAAGLWIGHGTFMIHGNVSPAFVNFVNFLNAKGNPSIFIPPLLLTRSCYSVKPVCCTLVSLSPEPVSSRLEGECEQLLLLFNGHKVVDGGERLLSGAELQPDEHPGHRGEGEATRTTQETPFDKASHAAFWCIF